MWLRIGNICKSEHPPKTPPDIKLSSSFFGRPKWLRKNLMKFSNPRNQKKVEVLPADFRKTLCRTFSYWIRKHYYYELLLQRQDDNCLWMAVGHSEHLQLVLEYDRLQLYKYSWNRIEFIVVHRSNDRIELALYSMQTDYKRGNVGHKQFAFIFTVLFI